MIAPEHSIVIGTPSAAPQAKRRIRIHFLDGIRGWAALMVVLAHLVRGIAEPSDPSFHHQYLRFLSDGSLAVYIFFIVSGFALSIGYFEQGRLEILTSSALRRYPRLTLPILMSSVLALIVLRLGWVFSHAAAVIAHSEFWLGTFYNFSPSLFDAFRFSFFDVYFDYDFTHTYNSALWTMSIEFSGSMLVFGLLAVFGKLNRVPIYLIAGAILAMLKSPLLAFVFGMALADAFANGRISQFEKASWAPFLSIVLVVSAIIFSTFSVDLPSDPRLLAIAALCIVSGITLCGRLRTFFETAASRLLGHLSFPLYLTHTIVIVSFSSYILVTLVSKGYTLHTSIIVLISASIPVCFVVAAAFSPVEYASIRLGHMFARVITQKL
jgi:peptidoglycan/LPS O-acetylase OafA/YrhL